MKSTYPFHIVLNVSNYGNYNVFQIEGYNFMTVNVCQYDE